MAAELATGDAAVGEEAVSNVDVDAIGGATAADVAVADSSFAQIECKALVHGAD